MAAQDERKSKPRGKWGAGIRDRFLALLRETGNARAALRVVGHASMFYKRRRRDPAFARAWAEEVAAVDARLGKAESRFPPTEMGTVASNCPRSPVERLGAFAIADPSTLLRPAPKKKPKVRGHVIRRTSSGRVQIALARECEMTAEGEAEFLARLRATGNFSGSARAVGFQPASLFDRYRKWPAFARACDEAVAAASVELDFALVAHAHRLLGTGAGGPHEDAGMGTVTSNCPPDVPFDPDRAMRILAFLERRRGGGSGRGPRKGPPDRSFGEAVASVMAKIAAIVRHKQTIKERKAEEGGNGDRSELEGGDGASQE